MLAVIVILGLVLAIVIVNVLQQVFMRILDIDAMAYSIKTKIIIIAVVWFLFVGLMVKGCGVQA